MKFYGNNSHPLADMPFNFFLITDFNDSSTAEDLENTIHAWIDRTPEGKWPNWVVRKLLSLSFVRFI